METIRVSDFTGGVSEVADPSAIPPNSAVSAYNVDPRTGVFTPVRGLGDPVLETDVANLYYYPTASGSRHFESDTPYSVVLWGDYILWSTLGINLPSPFSVSFNFTPGVPRAAKYDKQTGERIEERTLGLLWTTREQNEAIDFATIRGMSFSFNEDMNNLSDDYNIRETIEPAADDLVRQPQRMAITRTKLWIRGHYTSGQINVSPGDWIALVPCGSGPDDTPLCARPCTVVDVEFSGFSASEGVRFPMATIIVSCWEEIPSIGTNSPTDNLLTVSGVKRGTPYNTNGFQKEGVTVRNSSDAGSYGWYKALIHFKRDNTTFDQFVMLCRAITNRYDPDYVGLQYVFNEYGHDVSNFAGSGNGGMFYYIHILPVTINGEVLQYLCYDLYDYKVYGETRPQILGVPSVEFSPSGVHESDAQFPLAHDIICFQDQATGTVNSGTPILGILSKSNQQDQTGLNPGLYRYAFTQVDSWGRESAPWPLNEIDKEKPFVDMTGQMPIDNSNTALYARISGLPIPEFSDIQKIRVYRTRSDDGEYFYHSEIEKDESGNFPQFVDTVSDFNLSVIPMLADQYYPPGTIPKDEGELEYEVKASRYLTEYRGVLFAAVGSRLIFSLPGRFYAWPPSNYFLLPGDITGLLPAGDVLLIFTATHTYRLTGNTFSTMDFRQVSDEYGCVNHATAKLVNRVPVWCSLNGIAVFDGARVKIVTDDIIDDNSEQFKGAYSAVAHRGEYFVLLTPTQNYQPTKHNPLIGYATPEFTNYLRYKPGAWVVFGRFIGLATDLAVDHHKGEIHAVIAGKARPMFKGTTRQTANWKSGELHGGFKTLEKEAQHWFVTVSEGTVRLSISDTAGTKIEDDVQLEAGEHIKRFPAESFCRALSFEFKGSGVVTEFGYTFKPLAMQ